MHEGPLDPLLPPLRDVDLLEGEGVKAGVVDGRRYAHRRRREVLDLFGVKTGVPNVLGEFDHIGDPAPRMAGHEVRDEVLPLRLPFLEGLEPFPEGVEGLAGGFSHAGADPSRDVFGGDLEVPGDVVFADLGEVLFLRGDQVIADARGDEDVLHPRDLPDAPEQAELLLVAAVERGAIDTAAVGAGARGLPPVAVDAVHVRRRPADVLHDARKLRHRRHPLHLPDDGVDAPALDDPSLVVGEGAERAGAETPPVADDREPDGFEGRDRLGVGGVGPSSVGEFVDAVEFSARERHRRRVLDDDGLGVRLRHRTAPQGVLLAVVLCKRPGVGVAVLLHLPVAGEDRVSCAVHAPPRLQVDPVGGAGDIGERACRFTRGKAACDRDHLALAHAEDEEVGRGVGEDGLPD
ncbi:hypothetical protein ES707_10545 [subsurface metagenome]